MQLRPIDQPDGTLNELNYYHCVLSGLPFDLPMASVVDLVTPTADSAELVELKKELGYLLVPHQLHVFKEKLPRKFAAVTYFLQPVPATPEADATGEEEEECCSAVATPLLVENEKTIAALSPDEQSKIRAKRAKAHALIVKYFGNGKLITPTAAATATDAATESNALLPRTASHSLALHPQEPSAIAAIASNESMKDVVFKLCQPLDAMNCMDFLNELDSVSELLKVKEDVADVKKLRTWMLTKALMASCVTGEDKKKDGSASLKIGFVSSETITAIEWAWLRTQHKKFPATATSELITAFFVKGFHPFFSYKDTIVISN